MGELLTTIIYLKKFILKTKMNIDEKIRELNEKDGGKFNKRLMENLRNKDWCGSHGIDYIDPDVKIAREKTYQEIIINKNNKNNKNIPCDDNNLFKGNYLRDYIKLKCETKGFIR